MKNNFYLVLLMLALAVFSQACSSQEAGSNASENNQSSGDELEEIELNLSTGFGETSTQYKGLQQMAEFVSEETNGKFTIKIYPNNLYASSQEGLEGVQSGNIDIVQDNASKLATIEPKFNVFSLPFLFDGKEHVYKVVDGEIGQAIYDELEKDTGVKVLGSMDSGFRNIANSVRKIESVQDLEGLQIRSINSPINIDMLRAIGANPVPMAWGELYTALQQGTVDGADMPIGHFYSYKMYEVQDYYDLTGLYFALQYILISQQAWESLPEEYQSVLTEGAKVGQNHQRELLEQQEQKYIEHFKENGVTITEPSPKMTEKYRGMVEPVWQEYTDIVGEGVIERILELGQ